EGVVAALAAEARLLVPAEGEARVVEVVGVDPDRARLQRLRRAERLLDVPRPDRGGEAVDRRVADRDGIALVLEGERREDRPKDLLARDRHLRRHAVEDRRLEDRALAADRDGVAARDEPRALILAALDVARDVLALLLGDERAEPRLGIERVARRHLLRALRDL